MNYLVEITKLVRLAKYRQIHCPLVGYKERHHIVPKCFGKLFSQPKSVWNDKNNIVHLTAAEHFKIHVWLYEWFKGYYGTGHMYTVKMIQGLNRLLKGKPVAITPNINITPEEYEYWKKQESINKIEGHKLGLIISPLKGRKYSQKHRDNISKSRKIGIAKGIIKSRKGVVYSEEYRQRNSIAQLKSYASGTRCRPKPHSKESHKNQSETLKNKYKNGIIINPNKGKKYSKERCEMMAKNKRIFKYKIINNKGTLFQPDYLKDFCENYNVNVAHLHRTLNKNIWAKGFKIISKIKLNIDDNNKSKD